MIVWRVSNHSDLSGEGGRKAPGRWHEKGRPVVYCSEHPALALLEIMVHLEVDRDDLPADYQLLEIEWPATVVVAEVTVAELNVLSPNWASDVSLTRQHLRKWFDSVETAVVSVPSVIAPASTNFLINPLHVDASKIAIVSAQRYPYDQRLFAGKVAGTI